MNYKIELNDLRRQYKQEEITKEEYDKRVVELNSKKTQNTYLINLTEALHNLPTALQHKYICTLIDLEVKRAEQLVAQENAKLERLKIQIEQENVKLEQLKNKPVAVPKEPREPRVKDEIMDLARRLMKDPVENYAGINDIEYWKDVARERLMYEITE